MTNLDDTVKRAMEEPTLVAALSVACIWEAERAIKQARDSEDGSWETCFRFVIEAVLEKWETGSMQDALEHISRLQDRNEILRATMTKMKNRAAMIVSDHDEVVG